MIAGLSVEPAGLPSACSAATARPTVRARRTRTCNLLIRSQVLYPLSYGRSASAGRLASVQSSVKTF